MNEGEDIAEKTETDAKLDEISNDHAKHHEASSTHLRSLNEQHIKDAVFAENSVIPEEPRNRTGPLKTEKESRVNSPTSTDSRTTTSGGNCILCQLVVLSLILFLQCIPLWPRLVGFVQGFLFTIWLAGVLLVWKFGKWFSAPSVVKSASLTNAQTRIECSSLENKEEKVFMKYWPAGKGHYDVKTFDEEETKSVQLILTSKDLQMQFPDRQVEQEKSRGNVEFSKQKRRMELKSLDIFLLPQDLSRHKWFNDKYPIVLQCSTTNARTAIFYYLFACTNQEKQVWFNKIHSAIAVAKGKCKTSEEDKYHNYTHKFYQGIFKQTFGPDVKLKTLNKILSRFWYSMHYSPRFNSFMRRKLSKNLRKVKVAKYFRHVGIEELLLPDQMPIVTKVYTPSEDDYGFWIDFDIELKGEASATIRTHGIRYPSRDDTSTYTGGLADEGNQTGWGGFVKPFLMNKIMELPWVKENIASKPITLHFRLRKFIGTMVINLPPSTTDRLWYGFRKPPKWEFEIEPCLGGLSLTEAAENKQLSTWEHGLLKALVRATKARIKKEFVKKWVYPDMGNLVVPFFK